MKKSLVVLFVLLLSVSLMAQVRTGNIRGKVTDTEGTALPGVSVTLSAPTMAPITAITSEGGSFRFPALPPGNEYTLAAELTGFKKQIKSGVIVTLGQESEINLVMEIGKLEEEVTVTAVTPVVDAKKTAVGKNVTQEALQSLPSARDPWVVMQMAPSIILDRENVGGSESGQQASYVAKGDASGGGNNVWAVDGLVVTDPAAIGASPGYWDFDAFEEMNITTGGSDVTVQTGGVALNMVTRRGGNKVTLGGRFLFTDEYFQANNLTDALRAQGVTNINRIVKISDYGFNLGGPIVKDKAWMWGSYGVQDINSLAITGATVKPTLQNFNAKLNLQLIPENRFEAFLAAGEKKFIGRSATQQNPQGLDQAGGYHFGTPIIKLQDEHMFGSNLLMSLKFGFMNAGFQMLPHNDPDLVHLATYDFTQDLWTNSINYYMTNRPMYDYNGFLNYFSDNLLGAAHDIKLGVEYSTRGVTSDSSFPGDIQRWINLNYPDIDPAGTGNPVFTSGMNQFSVNRRYNLDYGVKQLAVFGSDTVSFGRFNLLLGVRYDHQTPQVNSSVYSGVLDSNPAWSMFDADVIAAFKEFLPDVTVPNITPDYAWDVVSPRIGLTYDIFGTGKTLLKLNFAMYGDFMGSGSASYLFNPLGTTGGFNFWWLDANADGRVNANEVLWNDPVTYAAQHMIVDGHVDPSIVDANAGTNWYSMVPFSTALEASRFTVDKDATSSRTTEYLATIEHELLADFNVGLSFTYRNYNRFSYDIRYYPETGTDLKESDYVVAGQIPGSITGVDLGAGAGRPYYLLAPGVEYTAFMHHKLNDNSFGFWGVDFVFNKRLSNNWMLDGSVSYMDQWRHYGAEGALGFDFHDGADNLSSMWALQDQLWAPNIGGASGKINQYLFSHWMVKLQGLYQLPYGFDISFTFNARAGHIVPHYMALNNAAWPNSQLRTTTAYLDIFGKGTNGTLPTFYQLNLRLEKMIKLGDTGRIYLMADAFNVLNSAIINRRYDRNEGTYYAATGVFRPYANNFRINEILNPFIARFGVRFQF